MIIAVVCGAGGFIGHALVERLKTEGYYVRALSRNSPLYSASRADEYIKTDLRYIKANDPVFDGADEVYQCAGNTGGLGYLETTANDFMLLRDNILINMSIAEACCYMKVKRLLFVSSSCVYSKSKIGIVAEHDAYPAEPANEFGWASLIVERLLSAMRNKLEIRIVRLHSTYGPKTIYKGGKERAPAAMCRKVAEARDHSCVELWGNGQQTRSFMFIDDAVEGIRRVMNSDCSLPINVGSTEEVTISRMISLICRIAGKTLVPVHVPGPIGVSKRCCDNTLLKNCTGGWEPCISLEKGLRQTYLWIEKQLGVDKLKAVV